ncbi:ATP-binding protein [Streptomyces tsukubensis]|uniref:Histidine kinase/HSP90-like ATPase domain-containing protein n=1 Tax=Streptomyces tsukubensis TaxID=83656 RepID=A0A1V4AAM4_9ACTN|nr:hypothetical protein B1H18_12600 [Streptomyces tsukubensis]QFR98219.1 ATP-binding protein [Streptomyces tsukubensis]
MASYDPWDHDRAVDARHELPTGGADARARVRDLLRAHAVLPGQVKLADMLLVTSELVTNAIRHGGGLVRFEADLTEDGLVLVVADRSTEPPRVFRADDGRAVGGYGWPLTCRVAAEISIRPGPGGKTIRAVVSL